MQQQKRQASDLVSLLLTLVFIFVFLVGGTYVFFDYYTARFLASLLLVMFFTLGVWLLAQRASLKVQEKAMDMHTAAIVSFGSEQRQMLGTIAGMFRALTEDARVAREQLRSAHGQLTDNLAEETTPFDNWHNQPVDATAMPMPEMVAYTEDEL